MTPKSVNRRTLLAAGFAAALPLAHPFAHAQAYPSKPVKFIVPFGVGGNTDAAARLLGAKLAERWGHQVLVENRTGAEGNLGTEAAVKSPPDGYTLYFGTNTLTINKLMAPSAAFDPMKDLLPIALIGATEFVLGVHPDVPAHTVAELIAYAKANPGKLRYGATSFQGVFATEQFNALAGTRIERVPYRAMSNVQVDLLAGRIEVFLTTPASVAQYINTGKLRALGVTADKPLPGLPDVKPIGSALPNLKVATWYGLFAPLKTPPEMIAKVAADLRWAVDQPDVRAGLEKVGVSAQFGTAEDLRAQMIKDVATVEDLVRKGVMKPGS
ncbi:Bug family tripartite tricarboxylate transporter substrate binding protein [Ramlibacter sp.]|uniref:Bug family tripartite tricarboxylate transporter substrate binding protein n=1 Tax=Ramlibacter sp. TaxID=1917967 RepID=UPI003D0D4CD2